MTKLLRDWALFPICMIVPLVAGGCNDGGNDDQANQPPPGADGGGPPGIRQIMGKLTKGPNSLTPLIGNELQQDPPPWDTIQGQAKEYAKSAAELGTYDPPRGAKESWTKLTAEFAETGAELEKAAMAKDKAAAILTHDQLKNSCNACHQEHRRMGRGGGPGGPPQGGSGQPPQRGSRRPPGGPNEPPPGGPGGPPPDAPQ
jgi:hypothetical protein